MATHEHMKRYHESMVETPTDDAEGDLPAQQELRDEQRYDITRLGQMFHAAVEKVSSFVRARMAEGEQREQGHDITELGAVLSMCALLGGCGTLPERQHTTVLELPPIAAPETPALEPQPLVLSPEDQQLLERGEYLRHEDQEKFRLLLTQLDRAGYTISPDSGITMSGSMGTSLDQHILRKNSPLFSVLLDDVESALMNKGHVIKVNGNPYRDYMANPHRSGEKTVHIQPYELQLQLRNGEIVLVARNWLTNADVYSSGSLHFKEESLAHVDQMAETIVGDLDRAMTGHEAQLLPELRIMLDNDTQENVPPYVSLIEASDNPPHPEAAAFFGQFAQVQLHAQSEKQNAEDGPAFGTILDADFFENTHAQPLNVHGRMREMILVKNIEPSDPDYADQMARPFHEEHIDEFGNVIWAVRFKPKEHAPMEVRIIVHFPTAFEQEDDTAPTRETPVDLSGLSVPVSPARLEGYFAQDVVRPIAQPAVEPYRLYASSPDIHPENFGERLTQIREGAARMETLYGKKSGEVIRQISFVDSRFPNAHFDARDPHAIAFIDEMMRDPAYNAQLVATHESSHLFTEYFDRVHDDPAIVAHFQSLSREFLTELAEDRWMDGKSAGGHPWGNALEFLASLSTSLFHPEWTKKIRTLTPAFQQTYRESLIVFRDALLAHTTSSPERSPERVISPDAPIFTKLDAAIFFIGDASD